MAARRLNNAIVAWTDLLDLATYAWLASVMWVPVVAAWTLAWNRWCLRPWRSIDVSAVVLAVAGTIGAVIHSASVTSGSRLGSIALFVVIGARIVRSGPMRILALVTLASIMAALFGGELLDTIGVPGIWFPFGIGVSRTQYVYAIAIPLLAFLIVTHLAFNRRCRSDQHAPMNSLATDPVSSTVNTCAATAPRSSTAGFAEGPEFRVGCISVVRRPPQLPRLGQCAFNAHC